MERVQWVRYLTCMLPIHIQSLVSHIVPWVPSEVIPEPKAMSNHSASLCMAPKPEGKVIWHVLESHICGLSRNLLQIFFLLLASLHASLLDSILQPFLELLIKHNIGLSSFMSRINIRSCHHSSVYLNKEYPLVSEILCFCLVLVLGSAMLSGDSRLSAQGTLSRMGTLCGVRNKTQVCRMKD